MREQFNTIDDRLEHFEEMSKHYGVIVDTTRLFEMGFFTAPSSTRHHGVYEGGNYDHSTTVADFLIEMTEAGKITWKNPRSPWVVGIFHDLCKSDQYKLVSLEQEEPRWEWSDSQVLSGHGDKSIMLLSQFLALTDEEVLCIRYHMGAYVKDDWDGYDRAIKLYPSVLWTHTADMYASKVVGV